MKNIKTKVRGRPKRCTPVMIKVNSYYPKDLIEQIEYEATLEGVDRADMLRKFCSEGLKMHRARRQAEQI